MNQSSLLDSARNAWALSPFGLGFDTDHLTESVLLYDKPHARVERIAPTTEQTGNPVLLVTPLAVPVSCWDLRPGQSMAAHLATEEHRPTYTIDYGEMTFADRSMGFEHWVDGILPEAVRRISAEHGKPVHLVGWSHGGTMSLLLGAHLPELPIASITAIGTPTDYRLNFTFLPFFIAHEAVGLAPIFLATRLVGGTTAPVTRLGYRWLAPVRELTKPWALARNLHRPEVLAKISAVDRFIDEMPGYPGRFFNQAIGRIVVHRDLANGTVHLTDDLKIDMDRLEVPTLLIGSTTDVLANAASVEAGVDAYRNADVKFVEVAGFSHLGLIASSRARELTWPAVDEHLAANATA